MVNRDLSTAVLRHFIGVREAELAAGTLKKRARARGAPAPPVQEPEADQPVSSTKLEDVRWSASIALKKRARARGAQAPPVQEPDADQPVNFE